MLSIHFQSQEINHDEALKKCRKEFNKKTCLSDEDQDEVLFYLDQCPKEKGPFENNGCPWPDEDKDGVIDLDDACPKVSGPWENNGCPWPDTDGDGILDKDDPYPTSPFKNGKDCEKLYQEEKKRYEKSVLELEKTDFSGLLDIIFKNSEFKKLAAQNKKILFLKQFIRMNGPECGNDPYYDCKHYGEDINPEIFKKLWNKDNFNKLRKSVGNKTIIPLIVSGVDPYFRFNNENEENNYFQLNNITPYYKGKLKDNGKERIIYYAAPQKPEKELVITLKDEKIVELSYVSFGIAVLPQYDLNLNMKYLVQLYYSDETGSDKYSEPIFYEYKDGKWSFDKMLE